MEQTTNVKLYVGSAYGFLSRVQARTSRWDAYWSARSCLNLLEEVLEEDPQNYDAYMGKGVIEYFTAVQITGFWGAVAWMVGMKGDRETGLQYFENVAEKGNLFKQEGRFARALVNRYYETNYQQAEKYLVKLRQEYPNNSFIDDQFYQVQFLKLIEEKGVQFLTAELDSLQTKYRISNPGTLNTLGYDLMLNQNRMDDALVVFQTNVKLFPDVANGYDSLGECYRNRNEIDKAIESYQTAYQKLDADTTINDEFRERLRTSITEILEEMGAGVNI